MKDELRAFFQDRFLSGSLSKAVHWTLLRGLDENVRYTWLCVTKKGVAKVNLAALLCLEKPIDEA